MVSPKFFHHFVKAFAALASASCCAGLFGNGSGKGNGPGRTSNPKGSVSVTGLSGYEYRFHPPSVLSDPE